MKSLKFGLLPRIVAGLIGAALIPLAVASVQLIRVNTDAMLTQVLRTHSVAAVATAGRLGARIDALRSAGASVGGAAIGAAEGDRQAPVEVLTAFLAATPQVAGVALVDSEGREILRAQRRRRSDDMAKLLVRPLDRDPHILALGEGRWLALDVELEEGGSWLRMLAEIEDLERTMDPEDLGDEAQLVVMTRDGEAILGGDPESGLKAFPSDLVDAGRSGKMGGAGRYAGEAGEVVGAFNPVPGTPWVVLSRQPAAVAEVVALRMKKRATMAVVTAVLLGTLLSIVAYRSLVRPLRNLLDAQRRLAGLSTVPSGGNELEDLKENLALLERRVNDKEDLGKIFLGRFQVIEVIGEGAMGSVFRGWDPKLERMVALKTIRLGLLGNEKETLAGHLVREAVMVARFSHPHIVAVYDVEDAPDAAFLAMEFVEGTSLHQHLQAMHRLPAGETVVLGRAVAEALAVAHERNIVHHDVKPGNVLLGYDGSIKMADFGIARGVSQTVDKKAEVFGTPGYLPPEALIGEGYDERGDLFAMGVVLYQCLVGHRPFTGSNFQEIFENTRLGVFKPIEKASPLVPQELSRLITALLSPDRKSRPSTASAVAEHLGRLADMHGYQWVSPQADGNADTEELQLEEKDTQSQLLPTISFADR